MAVLSGLIAEDLPRRLLIALPCQRLHLPSHVALQPSEQEARVYLHICAGVASCITLDLED